VKKKLKKFAMKVLGKHFNNFFINVAKDKLILNGTRERRTKTLNVVLGLDL
jgi:hypothetical protein